MRPTKESDVECSVNVAFDSSKCAKVTKESQRLVVCVTKYLIGAIYFVLLKYIKRYAFNVQYVTVHDVMVAQVT